LRGRPARRATGHEFPHVGGLWSDHATALTVADLDGNVRGLLQNPTDATLVYMGYTYIVDG